MLRHLSVRNFAIVHALDVSFGQGLTVITGESGAGKSVLVGALSLILGSRASRQLIRPKTERCEVTAELDVGDLGEAKRFLESNDLLDEDDPTRCLVRRTASIDGRSRAWVNSVAVSVGVLRDLCSSLIDIYGQFEQQQLMKRHTQRVWFDDYCADQSLSRSVSDSYRQWRSAEVELHAARERFQSATHRYEQLTFQAKVLNEVQATDGEFEELSSQHKRISQAQAIIDRVNAARIELDDQIMTRLGHHVRELERIEDDAASLVAARKFLADAQIHLDEAKDELRAYSDILDIDEATAAQISERLDELYDAARRLHVRPQELPEFETTVSQNLQSLTRIEDEVRQLELGVSERKAAYLSAAAKLTELRKSAAPRFRKEVEDTVSSIGLHGSALQLAFHETIAEHGAEDIEYLFTANSNYPPRPLSDVASGGELSRVSLAIQLVAAERSQLPCLVLDEADLGVGGLTADVVGRLLRKLSDRTQVICITHAPQVAALGSSHIRVEKTEQQDIHLCTLDTDARIEEIARMVGGQRITGATRDYAKTLLAGA